MKYDVFISYRRDGGRDIARSIKLALEANGFKDRVFFDYNSLRDGVFNKQIYTAIEESSAFLIVMTKGWADRCVNEEDWVRKEIEYAIEKGKNIIPLNINNSYNGLPEQLSSSKMTAITSYQFITIYGDDNFDDGIKRLIEIRLNNLVEKDSEYEVKKPNNDFVLTLSVDETSELFVDDEKICKIKAGGSRDLDFFQLGIFYNIKVINMARKKEVWTVDYERPAKKKKDSLSITFLKTRKQKEEEIEKSKIEKRKKKKEKEQQQGELLRLTENYDWAGKLREDTIKVRLDGKFGFVNLDGFEIIPCIYDNASCFNSGFAWVCSDNKWSVIDKDGLEIIDFISDKPSLIYKNTCFVSQNNQLSILSLPDAKFSENKFDELYHTNSDDIFIARNGETLSFVDKSGNKIVSDTYDSIEDFKSPENIDMEFLSYTNMQKQSDKWLSVNYKTEFLSNSVIKLFPFKIRKKTGVGVISENCSFKTPCTMDNIINHDNNFFIVKIHEKYGVLDLKNKKYSIMPRYEEYGGHYNDSIVLGKCFDVEGIKYGLFRYDGKELIKIQYDTIRNGSGIIKLDGLDNNYFDYYYYHYNNKCSEIIDNYDELNHDIHHCFNNFGFVYDERYCSIHLYYDYGFYFYSEDEGDVDYEKKITEREKLHDAYIDFLKGNPNDNEYYEKWKKSENAYLKKIKLLYNPDRYEKIVNGYEYAKKNTIERYISVENNLNTCSDYSWDDNFTIFTLGANSSNKYKKKLEYAYVNIDDNFTIFTLGANSSNKYKKKLEYAYVNIKDREKLNVPKNIYVVFLTKGLLQSAKVLENIRQHVEKEKTVFFAIVEKFEIPTESDLSIFVKDNPVIDVSNLDVEKGSEYIKKYIVKYFVGEYEKS